MVNQALLQNEKDLEINKYFAPLGGDDEQFVIYWRESRITDKTSSTDSLIKLATPLYFFPKAAVPFSLLSKTDGALYPNFR
jgi:hypothetical protein